MTDTEKPCGCRIVPELIPKWDQFQSGTAFVAHVEYCPLHAAAPKLLEAAEGCAALADDTEGIPYPLRVRFRLACYEAEKAVEVAKERE